MAIVVDEFGEDHEASQVCVKMVKSLWVQVWLDLESGEYTILEIEEMAGTAYIAAIQRANNYPLLDIVGVPAIELETVSTNYLEVKYE